MRDHETGRETDAAEGPSRHLRVLRQILSRDYLAAADWRSSLGDLARCVRDSLEAQEAMVAVWDAVSGSWDAVSAGGVVLRDESIASLGSLSSLEQVRVSGEPLLATRDEELALHSPSIRRRRIAGLLVAPVSFWDVAVEPRVRAIGGCVYAHRTLGRAPFTREDVEIVLDIARLAEPVLSLQRHLMDVERRLSISEHQLGELRRASRREGLGDGGLAVPPRVLDTLERIVKNDKVTILVTGPTGSGKSSLARAYHEACPRRDRPFVTLDCGSVTAAETLGAELFGYTPRSGFANAPQGGAPGKAALAHGGTLFVDEISNLAVELQPKLLRLIQEGRYSPLGAGREEVVDIQVIAATNADLLARVKEGSFREDLYHRLNVIRVHLPTLDERSEEIPRIAERILERACAEAKRPRMAFRADALPSLVRHGWAADGNIRGLENLVRRSVWAAPVGKTALGADDLFWISEPGPSTRLGASQDDPRPGRRRKRASSRSTAWKLELDRVTQAIREHGNGASAAEALSLSYRQLYWTLQRAGLTIDGVLRGAPARAPVKRRSAAPSPPASWR